MINLTKRVFVSMLCASMLFISCQDETEVVPPKINIEIDGTTSNKELNMVQDGTLKLKAAIEESAGSQVLWEVNNKEVSREVTYEFTATDLGKQTITLTVTSKDGGVSQAQTIVNVYGKYKHGTFILNEGNMTTENGFITFISPDGMVTDSAYYKVNKSSLGNTTQDLFITNNKIYIIAQNGNRDGGDGTLVIANAETLVKEVAYNEELTSTLSWPTHVAVVGADSVYIRDNKGVYLFNPSIKKLTFVEGTARATKNRMAVVDGKVFVPAGNNVYAIKGMKVDTLKFKGIVSGVIKSDDNKLWISCTTSPAQINKVNPTDYSVIKTNELGDAKVSAGWGATPGISAKGDTLYFSNASTKIYRHIFNSNQTKFMVDVKTHITDAGMVYNNLAVHPETGEVYFNTIKGFGWDFLVNNITVWNFSKEAPALKADYKNHTHFPAGIFFTANF